jgi:hypothetical protein
MAATTPTITAENLVADERIVSGSPHDRGLLHPRGRRRQTSNEAAAAIRTTQTTINVSRTPCPRGDEGESLVATGGIGGGELGWP